MPRTVSKTATHRALASESRQALLGVLRRSERPLDAAEASRAVGLHSNTARVHLNVLVDSGLVKRVGEQRTVPGRPRVLYEATSDAPVTQHRTTTDTSYRELARILVDQLGEVQDHQLALRAGRRWADALDVTSPDEVEGASNSGIDTVLAVLNDLGFDPRIEPSTNQDRLVLHQCPFADIAIKDRSVVCQVHLGMLSATFERIAPTMSVTGLDPLVSEEPLRCVVHLQGSGQP